MLRQTILRNSVQEHDAVHIFLRENVVQGRPGRDLNMPVLGRHVDLYAFLLHAADQIAPGLMIFIDRQFLEFIIARRLINPKELAGFHERRRPGNLFRLAPIMIDKNILQHPMRESAAALAKELHGVKRLHVDIAKAFDRDLRLDLMLLLTKLQIVRKPFRLHVHGQQLPLPHVLVHKVIDLLRPEIHARHLEIYPRKRGRLAELFFHILLQHVLKTSRMVIGVRPIRFLAPYNGLITVLTHAKLIFLDRLRIPPITELAQHDLIASLFQPAVRRQRLLEALIRLQIDRVLLLLRHPPRTPRQHQ